MKFATTRQAVEHHPVRIDCVVRWTMDEDGLGYKGEVSFFYDKKHRDDSSLPALCQKRHIISLRQTLPLGKIHVTLDVSAGGAAASADFDGTGINERDLYWAASWGILGIQNKHRWSDFGKFEECYQRPFGEQPSGGIGIHAENSEADGETET